MEEEIPLAAAVDEIMEEALEPVVTVFVQAAAIRFLMKEVSNALNLSVLNVVET